jgi:hypothetical protein
MAFDINRATDFIKSVDLSGTPRGILAQKDGRRKPARRFITIEVGKGA